MGYLWFVTILWAFSFSLIGVYLSGHVDNYFSVFSRVFLASLIFLPFIRFSKIPAAMAVKLMLLGGIQLSVMYFFFYNSFGYLSVPEVVLFTVFTPIYITLLYDLMKRRFTFWYLVTALLAVLGAVVIRYNHLSQEFVTGFLMVQGANVCFAIGQVGYKYLMETEQRSGREILPQHSVFGYFYLGALVVSLAGIFIWGDLSRLPSNPVQWGVLFWLGIVASGLGYFLWNKGATLVDQGALAIMNNALVPAGLLVNLLIWNRDVDLLRLFAGGSLILFALWFNQFWVKSRIKARYGVSSA